MQGEKPKLGISACLMGDPVRYNGNHCRAAGIADDMAPFFDFYKLCPEMGIGLGSPRESMHLRGDVDAPRLVGSRSGKDYTEAMNQFAQQQMGWVVETGLHGFILKKKSPSCGMARISVQGEGGKLNGHSAGLFADVLMKTFPHLPVEEEGRLQDISLKDNFIERVYGYRDWADLLASNPRPHDLLAFHRAHKLTMMAHSQKHYRELGRLAAEAGHDFDKLLPQYGELFMEGLSCLATHKSHANVLFHIAGYFKDKLTREDKKELIGVIDTFREKGTPLGVPMTLINHYLRKFPNKWLSLQSYFQPYPSQLNMRHHFQK